jgi:hypothetical protein
LRWGPAPIICLCKNDRGPTAPGVCILREIHGKLGGKTRQEASEREAAGRQGASCSAAGPLPGSAPEPEQMERSLVPRRMSQPSWNSRRRASSAEASVQGETQIRRTRALLKDEGVTGGDSKASKSWIDQQRQRLPSAPELRTPIGGPQERSGNTGDQRTAQTGFCGFPGTTFYTGSDMLPTIKRELGRCNCLFVDFSITSITPSASVR